MARLRGTWGKAWCAIALALYLGGFAAAPAAANDANSVPATVELSAAGSDGIVAPGAEALAYFSTLSSYSEGGDESFEYLPGSQVTFACAIDGRPVKCRSEYAGAESGEGAQPATGSRASRRGDVLPGPYVGSVPMPKRLVAGPHTITVIATDEDGTDPNPPAVRVTLDRKPPSKPILVTKPPRRSRIHKPNFRFRSEDDIRFVTRRDVSFFSRMRRVKPNREVFRQRGDAGFLATEVQGCPSLLTCIGRARVVYFVPGFAGLGLGMPEWLPPGLYEIFVSARDAAGNKSPLTRYRFRILRGPSR